MFKIGTDSFSVLLRLWRLLNPSSKSRRTTRSSTSDWEMPNSSNVCGTVGLNAVRAGASVAAMKDTEPHSPHRPNRLNCLHAASADRVNPLVKLCRDGVWRAFACSVFVCLQLAAATPAEQLFHQAQKAEHDGEIVKAYLLYAEAAAADPTNIDYWSRAQALRPAASLLDASPPKLELPSDKIDRTLFGHIGAADLEAARKPLPPPRLAAEPGRRDYDLQGDSKALRCV